ncbi:MAG: GtrA family protein [Anaerolineae bacterium]|jgi:putative flippase GtrA|nr:GtrA family protein [Anaerolineae bacterium]
MTTSTSTSTLEPTENTEEINEVVEVTKRVFRNPLDTPIKLIAARFGAKSKEVERFLKFAVVGISGAVIDLGLVIILQATVLPPKHDEAAIDPRVALVSLIAFTTAVLSNFIWTRLWVYPESRSKSIRRQLASFTFISFVGGAGRTVWVTVAHSFLGQFALPFLLPLIQLLRPNYTPGPVAAEKIGTLIATLIAMAVVMLWNFFANRYWTYNDVK